MTPTIYDNLTLLAIPPILNLSSYIFLMISFFLIAPELLGESTLKSMMRRAAQFNVDAINRVYVGLMVWEVAETNWGYFPEYQGFAPDRFLAFLGERLTPLPLRGAINLSGMLVGAFGYVALVFIAIFLAWSRWEHEARGWAIVLGVLFFIYASVTQIALAAGDI